MRLRRSKIKSFRRWVNKLWSPKILISFWRAPCWQRRKTSRNLVITLTPIITLQYWTNSTQWERWYSIVMGCTQNQVSSSFPLITRITVRWAVTLWAMQIYFFTAIRRWNLRWVTITKRRWERNKKKMRSKIAWVWWVKRYCKNCWNKGRKITIREFYKIRI